MSGQEFCKGVLELVDIGGCVGLEDTCDVIIGACGREWAGGRCGSAVEYIKEYGYEFNYYILGGELYQMTELEEKEDCGFFCEVVEIEKNRFKFFTSFYNGGTCLPEVLEDVLEDVFKKRVNK